MYSTVQRFTGLSGIDTTSMVEQLMKAESYKYDNLFKSNLKVQYQQEAFKSIGNKLLDIQNKKFNLLATNSFRKASTFSGITGQLLSSSGSTSSSANIKFSSAVSTGNYEFTVDKLASSDKITAQPVNQGIATAAEEVDFEGLASLENGGTINLTINDTSKAITLSKKEIEDISNNASYTSQEKMEALKSVLNEKVAAAFGSTGKAAFATADGKLKLEATKGNVAKMTDTSKTGLMGNLGFNTVSATTGKSSGSTTTGGSVNATNNFNPGNLVDITTDTSIKLTINGSTKSLTFTEDEVTDLKNNVYTEDHIATMLNNKIDETFGEGSRDKVNFSYENGAFSLNAAKGHVAALNQTTTEEGGLSGMELLGFDPNKNHTTAKTVPPTSISDIFGVESDLTFEINNKSFTFSKDTSLDSFISKINNSGVGVQATYSETSATFSLESTATGIANQIKFDKAGEDFFLNGGGFTGTATRANASDAQITLNGTQLNRSSNNFTIDGMNFQLNSVSTETEKITVQKNYSEVANTLKDFVATYNEMLDAIYEESTTSRPKSAKGAAYEPLTDAERAEMTDTQIKEWDEKARKGLLKNDETLGEIESSLRAAMSSSVTLSDGTKLSLSDFGISLDDWSKRGKLVIDEEAMTKGLEKYGDKVTEFMTATGNGSSKGIAERVNSALDDAVGSSGKITKKVGLSSSAYYTANNEYSNLISNNAKSLSDMLKYLTKKEDQYYNQFSAMEAAISNANNQLAAIQGLFV